MIRIAAGLEWLEGREDQTKWWKCVCVFHEFPTTLLHVLIHHPPSIDSIERIRGRGLPDDMSYQVRQRWGEKEFSGSGEGMSWLTLDELNNILIPAFVEHLGFKDGALESVVSLMKYLRLHGQETRLVFWSEVAESPK